MNPYARDTAQNANGIPFAGMPAPDSGRRALEAARRTAHPGSEIDQNPPRPRARDTSPAIRDDLPTFIVERAYFSVIGLPTSISATNGDALWYGLRRIRPDDIGQEFTLAGLSASLRPCDTDAAFGGVTAVGWGNASGFAARIIVSRNLPFRSVGTWEALPCAAAGVADDGSGNPAFPGMLNARSTPPYAFCQPFPTGKLNDTVPGMIERDWTGGAEQYRIVRNMSLDVALVVRQTPGLVAAGSGKNIFGFAEIALRLGVTRNVTEKFTT